jgi:branched-chain amino acid transport system substrate-binding protein
MKRILAPVLACALAAFAPGAVRGADAIPVELHAILSLTGFAAFLGAREIESLHALEGVVNANGGIGGRPLKIVASDDQSNSQVTVQIVSQFASQKVPVFIGPTLTAQCQAVAPLVDKDGPVSLCTSPTIIPRPGGYMFMAVPSIDDVVPFVLKFFRDKHLTRLALITSTDASGSDFEKRIDGALARPELKAISLVAREHFNITDLGVAAQISRIKAGNPQALISFTVGPPFGTLLRGISDADLAIPIFASGGNYSYAEMAQFASILPKELYMNGARGIQPDNQARGKVKAAQDTYIKAVRAAGIRPEIATSIVWDMTMIAVDALRKYGPSVTAEQVHQYFESVKGWSGIQGVYDFTTGDQRGMGESAATMLRWDAAKGDFVIVALGSTH